jgi:hypothetical protein
MAWYITYRAFGTYYYICPTNIQYMLTMTGTQWRSWLRHRAKSRKVMGSIPDGVTGIFHWHNPSSRIMALGLTQPLTDMSTRNISWGKGGRCVELTTLPPSCADCLEIWEPLPLGTLRVVMVCFTFMLTIIAPIHFVVFICHPQGVSYCVH